jgi:DNA-binding beta-propeller fold protein YncE
MDLSVLRLAVAIALGVLAGPANALGGSYLYSLSTVQGTVRTDALRLALDPRAKEFFAFGDGLVRIFNDVGMETYRFGDDTALGAVYGAAALEDGDLLVLSYNAEGKPRVVRCNFRGEPRSEVKLAGLPEGIEFRPGFIAYRDGHVYLADLGGMRVFIADAKGQGRLLDLADKLEVADKRADLGINGLTVDGQGNLVFTVTPLFKVFVVSPTGEVRSFGKPGGAPGMFNVIAGVAVDEQGRIFVADAIKHAVIAFDRDFRFLGEFGYPGSGPGNLTGPSSILATGGRVLVSQHGRRGVAVFKVVD